MVFGMNELCHKMAVCGHITANNDLFLSCGVFLHSYITIIITLWRICVEFINPYFMQAHRHSNEWNPTQMTYAVPSFEVTFIYFNLWENPRKIIYESWNKVAIVDGKKNWRQLWVHVLYTIILNENEHFSRDYIGKMAVKSVLRRLHFREANYVTSSFHRIWEQLLVICVCKWWNSRKNHNIMILSVRRNQFDRSSTKTAYATTVIFLFTTTSGMQTHDV